MNDELPPQHGPSGFLIAALVVGGLAAALSLLMWSAMTPTASPQLGRLFPPIEAAGWINSPELTADDFRGKVIVVDAWAFWCQPCRMATPYLLELNEKFKDRGVVFLGLTSEGRDDDSLKESREYVRSESIPWPNGYGAVKTLAALDVEMIPQFWIVDAQNRIVLHEHGWGEDTMRNMENVLNTALKSAPVKTKR